MVLFARTDPHWSRRILAPLVAWAGVAVGSWILPAPLAIPPVTAQLASLGLLFVTTAIYVFATCRDGAFPRAANRLLLAGLAGALGLGLSPWGPEFVLVRNVLLLAAVPIAADRIARMVEKPTYILPLLFIAMLADIWSVFHGPSQALVQSGAVALAVIIYPVIGHPDLLPRPHIAPAVGVMDWVFLGILVHAGVRHNLSLSRLAAATAVGLAAAALLLILYQVPLPLLATLAPAAALFWMRAVRPSAREILITLLFALAMGAIFVCIHQLRAT